MKRFPFRRCDLKQHLSKLRGAVGIIFLLPLTFAILFGFIYERNTVTYVPLVICDQEQSALSRRVVQAYSDSEAFSVVAEVTDPDDMNQYIASGKAKAGLDIPVDFSKTIKTGQGATLLLSVDFSNTMIGNAAMKGAAEINQTLGVAVGTSSMEAKGILPHAAAKMAYPVRMGIRILNNPVAGYSPFMLIGLVMNGLQIGIMLVLCPMVVGACKQKLPGESVWHVVGQKAGLCILMATMSFYLSLGAVHFLFHIPLQGSLIHIGMIVICFTYFVSAVMVFFASVSPSELLSIQIPLLYLMPGVLFSGLSWPAWYMNEFSQVFSFLLPLRHAAVPMRSLLLEGQAPGLWHSCAWMLTLGTVAFLMGSGIFSFRCNGGVETTMKYVKYKWKSIKGKRG